MSAIKLAIVATWTALKTEYAAIVAKVKAKIAAIKSIF